MKLNIGSKIAELRKENGVTQEQLAGAVGVSIAAVSKWECASAYPDITLLPAISSFFKVSVDALLDHQVDSTNVQEYRERLRELGKASDYHAGLPLAEEALKKYPNDFEILTHIGQFTLLEGTSGSNADRKGTVEKAIDYFYRSLAVKPSDSPAKKETIMHNIAYAYGSIREYEKAISVLEEINVNGCFDREIAYNLKGSGKISEAKSKLQEYLFGIAFGFGMLTSTLADCYREENNLQYVVDLRKFHAQFLQSFTHDTPNYCDSICVWSFHELAKAQMEIGDTDGMWASLDKCVYHAVRFDHKPSYAMASVKFMDGSASWLGNNSSQNACRGAIKYLKADFPQFQDDPRMIGFLQELEEAATDKRSAGVWK